MRLHQLTESKQGVAEGYPKHQDLSGVSTDKLKAYLAKQAKQSVPGEGGQVKRVQAELQRRSQGVAEGYQFKGPFPFDVDHMHGGRGINLPKAETKKYFTDKKQWQRAVDDINSSKYDDNSDYIGVTGRSTVEINGREWARWSDAQQKGYIELSSMSEQGVAEGGFKNLYAEFSGYGNYMQGRAVNVFNKAGLEIVSKEYSEDDDIQTYVVKGDRWAIEKAGEFLERNPEQFGGYHLIKQGMAEAKQRLDAKCWDGYKKQGTKMKGDTRVNNCVPESIDADQKKAKQVSGTEMPKKTSPVLGKAPKQHPFKGRAVGESQ
jgi:hypothetical protein